MYIGLSIDISKYIVKRYKQHLFNAKVHPSHIITCGDILNLNRKINHFSIICHENDVKSIL